MTYKLHIELNDGLTLNIGQPACDNCFKSKKRCDRNVPCSYCVRKNVKCEVKRPIKKERKMKDNKQFMSQLFNTDLSKDRTSKSVKPDLSHNSIQVNNNKNKLSLQVKSKHKFRNMDYSHFEDDRTNCESLLLYEPEVPTANFVVPKFNISSTAVGVFSIRGYIAIVNSQEPYAKLYAVKPTHSIYLFSLNTGVLGSSDVLSNKVRLIKTDPLTHHAELLNSAFEMYFTNHNPFFPLFTQMQFKGKKRGFKLKAAIWICGLTYLHSSTDIDKVIEYLKGELEIALQPSQLQVNLETIQFMCVLYSGLRGHPLAFKNSCFLNILTYATAIGLHETNHFYNHSDSIERYLAFAMVVALDISNSTYFLSWGTLIDLKPSQLFYSLTSKNGLMKGHLEERVKRNAILVIGYYYLVETNLAYQICQLLDPVGKTLTSHSNQKRLVERQHRLINDTLLELHLKLYQLQKLIQGNAELVDYLEDMHSFLGIVSSSMQSYIGILNGRLNPTLNKYYTPVVINYVSKVLSYSKALGEKVPIKFRRRIFATFSATMAVFQVWTGEERTIKLLKGFKTHMQSLFADHSMQNSIMYSLGMLDSTCQAFGIDLDSVQLEE